MIDAYSADYQAGFKEGLKSEQELRKAAAQLITLQKQERKHRNKNLRNQARSLLGEWLEIFSKSCWEEGSPYTVHKMAHDIAENWEKVVGSLTIELQRQMVASNKELQEELNKENSTEEDPIIFENPPLFDLLLKKLSEISKNPYQIDSIKKYIRRSKPLNLTAGRPRKDTCNSIAGEK